MSRFTLTAALLLSCLAGPALAQTAPTASTPAPPAAPAATPSALPPATPANAEVTEALARYDTDKDQKISASEWTAAGRQERGFTRFDANADGFLVESELAAALAMMAQMRARQGQ